MNVHSTEEGKDQTKGGVTHKLCSGIFCGSSLVEWEEASGCKAKDNLKTAMEHAQPVPPP